MQGGLINKMKKYFFLLPVLFLVVAGFTVSAYAMNMPQPGPGFGQHIEMMAPEHPQLHGVGFGHMVSSMAQGNSCH